MDINVTGIYTPGGDEDRSIITLEVTYNDVVYPWSIYYPTDSNMSVGEYALYSATSIESDILRKMANSEPIQADIPDYYAKRRREYPSVSDQVGALAKGSNSPEYKSILAQIDAIKLKYPKPIDTIKPEANTTHKVVWSNPNWIYQEKTEEEKTAERVAYWADKNLNRVQFEFMVDLLELDGIITASINAMPESTEAEKHAKIMAKVLYKSGQEFQRLHPLFSQLAPAVGLTEQQLDGIWLNARSI